MGVFRFKSFMDERNVPIYTSLEPFFPKELQTLEQSSKPNAKVTNIVMTLDSTA